MYRRISSQPEGRQRFLRQDTKNNDHKENSWIG